MQAPTPCVATNTNNQQDYGHIQDNKGDRRAQDTQSGASLLQELTKGATRQPDGATGGSQKAKGNPLGQVLPMVVLAVVLRTLQEDKESKHRGRGEHHGIVLTEIVDAIYLSYMPASSEIKRQSLFGHLIEVRTSLPTEEEDLLIHFVSHSDMSDIVTAQIYRDIRIAPL